MRAATGKTLLALLLTGGLAGPGARAADPPDVSRDTSWVDRRVREWQPTAAERRFDEIGWAADLREAERLAKAHGRPVFLFTHDGRMAIGRC